MPQLVQVDQSPYGLSGGTIVTGTVDQQVDAFCFYPLEDCTSVVITFNNLGNGPLTLSTAAAGIPIYGSIVNVAMGSGTAIVYFGSSYYP